MDSTAGQLLLGVLATVGVFAAVGLGIALLAWTPVAAAKQRPSLRRSPWR